MRDRAPIALLALVFVAALSAHARLVVPPSPQELFDKSEVVVHGKVTAVKLTEKRSTVTLPGMSASVRMAEATVETLDVRKGEIGPTFTFRFATIDWDGSKVIAVDGPSLIDIKPGHAYRFFLKKQDEVYVSVLDGALDDGFTVEPLPGKPFAKLPQ